ncbi:MAG: hypothetical protein WCG15_10040, partial [Actinomycetes bacterium]
MLKDIWTWLSTTMLGEVPEQYKSQRITSKKAEGLLRSRLQIAFIFLVVVMVLIGARVIALQTFQRDKYLT